MIPFNKPFITGKELTYIAEAIAEGHLSGDGHFTKQCSEAFKARYGFGDCFLTTSGTDALEMAAILANIGPGDEVIMPSYTFVSTANAFILRGAKVVFVDSRADHPNMDVDRVEAAITPRTKVIVPMHYGGVACAMDELIALASRHGSIVVEDAAHCLDATYKGRPLGGIGQLASFSFHVTKNIAAGEGGLLTVNDPAFVKRAEVIREKGTDRSAFFRGEVDKYGWVDIGSSFLASELTAAFLAAQIEAIDLIQERRLRVWHTYSEGLQELTAKGFILPQIPAFASNNAHLFHILCPSLDVRTRLIAFLLKNGIKAVFHYQPLHASAYHKAHGGHEEPMPHATRYGDTLLRLPLYAGLTASEQDHVIGKILEFVRNER